MTSPVLNQAKQPLGKRIIKHFKRYWRLHVLALPCLLYLIFFCYMPMFGLTLAFQNYSVSKGFLHSEFVGFRNFEFIFKTQDAWRITRNTVLYNVTFLLLQTFLCVLVAILFNELYNRPLAKTLQTLMIMPNFLSMAVVGIIVYAFLSSRDGIVNKILESMGM